MTKQDRGGDYPIVQQLSVGINAVEDRLVLIGTTKDGDRLAALLTRRLLRQLLDKYADLLEGTSERAAQAAPGVRDEVLQMEHVSALAAGHTETGGAGGGEAPAPRAAYLVTDAHFQTRGEVLVLALDGVRRRADGPDGAQKAVVFALALDRTTAHKVLAMLTDKADEAGWDLAKPSAWTQKIKQAKAESLN